jgi:hypothetical protein
MTKHDKRDQRIICVSHDDDQPGEDGCEHFVTRLDAGEQIAQMQRVGARSDRHTGSGQSQFGPECRLELLNLRALTDPAAVERVANIGLRVVRNVRVEHHDALVAGHQRKVVFWRLSHTHPVSVRSRRTRSGSQVGETLLQNDCPVNAIATCTQFSGERRGCRRASAFPRCDAPGLCRNRSPSKKRAWRYPKGGAGNAGCPLHPQPRV